MTRTSMKVSTIFDLARDGKPLYLDTTEKAEDGTDRPKRTRIYGVRKRKSRFQVKLMRNDEAIWQDADHKQVVLAY